MSMRLALLTLSLLLFSSPLTATPKPKRYAVTNDRALTVTRDVLERKGYEVTRIQNKGSDQIVWYRAENHGHGAKPVRLVIHRDLDKIVFLETPQPILVAIDVQLK